jgi:prohibitin 2
MRAETTAKLIGVAILIFILVIAASSASYVVQPGYRGVEVTLGKVSTIFKPEGFGWKTPFVTTIVPVSVRQQTRELTADCYSSDLQQVKTELRVLYRVPESSVVKIYQQFAGDPFDSLIAPRVQEALKEATALQSAEQIVKQREAIKSAALAAAQKKVGDIVVIVDVVIQNIDLSHELETAIESKMVMEQEAAKAKFTQQKAQIEADTVVIKAKGDAESIKIRGEALKLTPAFIDLQIVEKWDGKAPLYVGGASGGGVNMLLPAVDLKNK